MTVEKIRVLIVDDHEIVRRGLSCAFENTKSIEIVGQATNGLEAVDLVAELKPDVILMDVDMPVMDGVEASRFIKESNVNSKVIMLTGDESQNIVVSSLAAGASGYCMKNVSGERLTTAIHSIHEGDLWVDSSVAKYFIESMPSSNQLMNHKDGSGQSAPFEPLSEREMEALRLLADGLSNRQIAERLIISPETVKSHVRHIMEKLGVFDRTQAAVQAVRWGMLA